MSEPFPPPPPQDPPPAQPVDYATPSYPGPYTGPAPSPDARTMGLLVHLLGIFTGFLGPLLIWLLKRDSHPFIDDQGKEALNFQLTLIIAYLIGGATACLVIGFFILVIAWICAIIFGILGAVAANRGEPYRYPFNIRFIK